MPGRVEDGRPFPPEMPLVIPDEDETVPEWPEEEEANEDTSEPF